MKTIYTTGVFDILHKGHFNILTKAASLGDRLVVGIQEDDSVRQSKGKLPVLNTSERVEQLKSLPFVSEVRVYTGTDQAPHLAEVKPDIMVQGDDWLATGDRASIVKYLKENNIRLVIFPYTQEISSTEIKKRVVANSSPLREDDEFLKHHFRFLPIDSLTRYEMFDEQRVSKLVREIDGSGTLLNPLTIGKYEDLYIILDGNNRLEALARLGAKWVPCTVLDYNDKSHVELTGNVHYVNTGALQILKAIESLGADWLQYAPHLAGECLVDDKVIATIADSEHCYPIMIPENSTTTVVEALNCIVKTYLGSKFERLSEFGVSNKTRVMFKRFTVRQIVDLCKAGQLLQTGITWHKPSFVIINMPIRVAHLKGDTKMYDDQRYLESLIGDGKIRFYSSRVYSCDD